jgi:hypothetical protein
MESKGVVDFGCMGRMESQDVTLIGLKLSKFGLSRRGDRNRWIGGVCWRPEAEWWSRRCGRPEAD